MINVNDILNRLRTLREERELHQGYVATQLGIDRTTYVRKEQGAIPITTEEWIKLAETLGKEPSYFFGSQPEAWDEQEALILKVCRALRPEEKRDLVCGIVLLMKNIRRKEVALAIAVLSKTCQAP